MAGDNNSNGRRLPGWLERWGKIAALVVVSAGAGGVLRDCVGAGAEAAGLQTIAHAKAVQALNDTEHQELRGSIAALKKEVEQARAYGKITCESLPLDWTKGRCP